MSAYWGWLRKLRVKMTDLKTRRSEHVPTFALCQCEQEKKQTKNNESLDVVLYKFFEFKGITPYTTYLLFCSDHRCPLSPR